MDKVAIVCGSPKTEFLAPFNDESWEIWVLGNRADRFKGRRITRIFEIHEDLTEHPAEYATWLVSLGKPLIVGETFPIKTNITEAFPYDAVRAMKPDMTLASSSAYMMAYAILNGAHEIGVYGVDMAVDDHEYFWQRPCMWGWINYAQGKGIKVHIPEESALCHMDYCEGRDWKGKKTERENQFALPPFTQKQFNEVAEYHQARVNEIEEEIRQLHAKVYAHNGAKQAYERLSKVARAVEAGQSNITLMGSMSLK